MKQIDENELKVWSLGGNLRDKIFFMIIKTPGCVKCTALINKEKELFKGFEDNVGLYEFKPSDTKAASVIQQVEVTSVPIILIRFQETRQENSDWKLGVIIPDLQDDLLETGNIMDAIRDNDQSYFGYNEFDEVVETGNQPMFNRLLHLIHGEADEELIKNRQTFKNSIN